MLFYYLNVKNLIKKLFEFILLCFPNQKFYKYYEIDHK